MREAFNDALKEATKSRDKTRIATLRLILAAIKDRDIEARGKGRDGVSDEEILGILAKMIRQREESFRLYEEAGRLDLAGRERDEIKVICDFLPKQMAEEEVKQVCRAVVGEVGANGLRDMGRCMGLLKERYPGKMDFSKASAVVKEILK
ncbi:GatB/YqeY domain-containing protein [Propylenella binzhouense]|uniref:GatB/YqeY domain-containing protein n=1 Tax=Propylenella binzhouense TaxID=2555902 RepID=A0A964T5D6_9HYPH|nr:GatB/YqeY domain-containing protein [Propylenella binzhouense]MYZ48475.1 GatB/YqeY domain-containing protein [Propylenella binzhouense]